MARKKKEPEKQMDLSAETIAEQQITEVLKENFMPYAMSVIISRAIVEIDGLKPSHRKVLYTMYKMGLLNGARAKSAKISGQVLVLNPHSDASAYETMVRMTADNEALLAPLIDSKGNFGKHYSDQTTFAASRYTEAKLAPIAGELFKSINKNTVPFVDNFDATTTEPTLLPETFPLILANASEGIAVGIASKIPSFNLRELCNAAIALIEHPDTDIMPLMPGPDFPSGGQILLEPDVMEKVYREGKGSIKLSCKYRVDPKQRVVEIYEIPYTTTDGAIIEDIHQLMEKGVIKEISDLVRNETDINGLKIAFDYKRGVDPDQLMKKLMSKTRLQTTFPCNFNVLIEGRPKTLGVYDILHEWTKWRRTCVQKALIFDLDKKRKDLHLMKGLEKILLDLDRAVQIVRETEKDEDVVPNLIKGFDLDSVQAEYVAEIKLRNFNKDYITNRTKDVASLKNEISRLEQQISTPREIDLLIIKDLKDVAKKYGKDRLSEIVPYNTDDHVYSEIEQDYDVKYYRTKEGYIKKVPASIVRSDTMIKTKDGDEILQVWNAKNSTEMLVFSRQGTVYKFYGRDIPDHKPAEMGAYFRNLFDMAPEDEPVCMTPLDPEGSLLFAFENGKIARTPMSTYQTKTNRRKILKAYSIQSPLIGMEFARTEEEKFAVKSSTGKILIFPARMVPLKAAKGSQGVQTLRLTKNAHAVWFGPARSLNLASYQGLECRKLPASGGTVKPEQPSLL